MDVAHGVGLGEDQEIVVALQIVGVVLETVPAEIRLRELAVLDLGAHRAVEHEDALGRGFAESREHFDAVGGADVGHGDALFRFFCSMVGRLLRTRSQAAAAVASAGRRPSM